jgi:hypothetical protein
LGEAVWLDRASALKVIRSSEWAQLRAPGVTLADFIGRSLNIGGTSPVDADATRFRVYIELTLDSFEQNNAAYVRENDNKKEYREDKLLLFIRKAMEAEVEQKFGPIPTASV